MEILALIVVFVIFLHLYSEIWHNRIKMLHAELIECLSDADV